MTRIAHFLRRSSFLLLAVLYAMSWVGADVWLLGNHANAAQVTNRSLEISSSANGTINLGAEGTGSNGARARHDFGLTLGSSGATIGSMIIMYCTSPIPVAADCTTPTGLTVANITAIAAQTGTFSGTFTRDTTTNNSALPTTQGQCNGGASTTRVNCLPLKLGSPTAQTGTPTLTLGFGGTSGSYIVNPTNDNETFYARMALYSDTSYTTLVDYGSVASSTAQQIDITAKVQEKLNFSVGSTYVAPGGTCTALNDTGALTLGDINGVLDNNVAYDAHSYFRVNTNATVGTVIKYSGATLTDNNSAETIDANTAETVSTPGTEQFGLAFDTGNANHSFTSLAPDTAYDEGSGAINGTPVAEFNFATASVTAPVTIATTSNIIACDTGDVRYIGNIATNTAAGVYTTTITYIAIPTY